MDRHLVGHQVHIRVASLLPHPAARAQHHVPLGTLSRIVARRRSRHIGRIRIIGPGRHPAHLDVAAGRHRDGVALPVRGKHHAFQDHVPAGMGQDERAVHHPNSGDRQRVRPQLGDKHIARYLGLHRQAVHPGRHGQCGLHRHVQHVRRHRPAGLADAPHHVEDHVAQTGGRDRVQGQVRRPRPGAVAVIGGQIDVVLFRAAQGGHVRGDQVPEGGHPDAAVRGPQAAKLHIPLGGDPDVPGPGDFHVHAAHVGAQHRPRRRPHRDRVRQDQGLFGHRTAARVKLGRHAARGRGQPDLVLSRQTGEIGCAAPFQGGEQDVPAVGARRQVHPAAGDITRIGRGLDPRPHRGDVADPAQPPAGQDVHPLHRRQDAAYLDVLVRGDGDRLDRVGLAAEGDVPAPVETQGAVLPFGIRHPQQAGIAHLKGLAGDHLQGVGRQKFGLGLQGVRIGGARRQLTLHRHVARRVHA